jgi:hypothetical protein
MWFEVFRPSKKVLGIFHPVRYSKDTLFIISQGKDCLLNFKNNGGWCGSWEDIFIHYHDDEDERIETL